MQFQALPKSSLHNMLGNVARMAGIGEGTGPLSVELPVERVRQFVYQVGLFQEDLQDLDL